MRLRPVSGTVNSIIEHSPAGTDSDIQFLISPGLRPQPGSPTWYLPSTGTSQDHQFHK